MTQAVNTAQIRAGKTARRVTIAPVGQPAPARLAADGPGVTFAAPTLPPKQTAPTVTPAPRRKRRYTPRARRCAYCGESFQPARKTARYCSAAHRQAAYRQRQQKRRTPAPPAPALEAATCARCGAGYFADPAHPSVYCGPRCKHSAWRERRAAAAPAIAAITGCSLGKAADVIDRGGLAAVSAQLEALGLHYDARARRWEPSPG
jgi:hypothetical protein